MELEGHRADGGVRVRLGSGHLWVGKYAVRREIAPCIVSHEQPLPAVETSPWYTVIKRRG